MLGVDVNTWVLAAVALMNVCTLYYARKTEINTNSMKDALVVATAKAAHAKGKEAGRKEEEAKTVGP